MAVMSEVLLKYRFIYGCERVANAFVNFIVSISSVKTCVLKVETLSRITDSWLVANGLNREETVRRVLLDAY